MSDQENFSETVDVILIGAGIMSATLGILLKELMPDIRIEVYERLDHAAAESSDAWNNAGTGHSAFCELNYTTEKEDGSIDISKTIRIAEQFEISRQLWSHLVKSGHIPAPENFIHSIPHMSFVHGKSDVDFLRKRYEAMSSQPLFRKMQFSTDKSQLEQWIPLVMDGRDPNEICAATRMELGTDVNFGSLTQDMFRYLQSLAGVTMHYGHEVRKIRQSKSNGDWKLKLKDLASGDKRRVRAKFVFIGAGGGSLSLLEKAGIPEGEGFGGFPVSGQWLRCTNRSVIEKHAAKVYGKASVGAPPMSAPHIDSRVINGKHELLFGPYAGFSTKFLKSGSYLDLPRSITLDNLIPMLSAGIHNLPLTKYLIDQVRQSPEERLEALREYVPEAEMADWELEIAGQRVQVIKKDAEGHGILEFGTEVIVKADKSLAVLLGASPGASTAASIMVDLVERCFKDAAMSRAGADKLRKMIPSYGQHLNENPELLEKIRSETASVLKLVN